MKTKYTIVTISDIHIGALPAAELMAQLDVEFIDKIEKMEELDLVTINGDLLDTKISANSLNARLLISFISKVAKVCMMKNAKLRIVKGTESHDNKQLDLLHFLSNMDIDYKIFNTVTDEFTFDNLRVLYVPEEYVTNIDEHYGEFFKNEYNLICGHGMFEEAAFEAATQESENTMSKAPVFRSKTFLDICKGPILFGHIHGKKVIKKRIFYTGSFTRWSYGESEDKGYAVIRYDTEMSSFNYEFKKNRLARPYITVEVDCEEFKDMPVSVQISTLRDIIDEYNEGNTRVIVTLPEDFNNSSLFINTAIGAFSRIKNLKLIIRNKAVSNVKDTITKQVEELTSRYDFVFDKAISDVEKIGLYIKERYGRSISKEKLSNYLLGNIDKK